MLQMETTIESSLVSLNHLQRVQNLFTSGIWMLIWWPLMATRAQVSPPRRFVIVVSQNSKNAQLCPKKSVTNICYNILGAGYKLPAVSSSWWRVHCPPSPHVPHSAPHVSRQPRVLVSTSQCQCVNSQTALTTCLLWNNMAKFENDPHVKQLKIIKSAGGSQARESGARLSKTRPPVISL